MMGITNKLHMVAFISICFLLAVTTATAQTVAIVDAKYTVPAGTTNLIPAGKSAILVEEFNLADGARIEISEKSPLLIIHAKEANVGNNATIIGRGRDGHDGRTGEPGEVGRNGPTIVLIFEQQDIRGLSVAALGGNGGDGGTGHAGAAGREAKCSGRDAENGGPGGKGGTGGNSGNGGHIFVVLPKDTGGYGISLNVNSGEPGSAGSGGPGGPGGRGKNRCGPWPYWKKGAGSHGATGPAGSPGNSGDGGTFRTYHVGDFVPDSMYSQLEKIISLLADGGYAGDADALRAVLESGLITDR